MVLSVKLFSRAIRTTSTIFWFSSPICCIDFLGPLTRGLYNLGLPFLPIPSERKYPVNSPLLKPSLILPSTTVKPKFLAAVLRGPILIFTSKNPLEDILYKSPNLLADSRVFLAILGAPSVSTFPGTGAVYCPPIAERAACGLALCPIGVWLAVLDFGFDFGKTFLISGASLNTIIGLPSNTNGYDG